MERIEPGGTFGDLRIEKEIGRGAYGRVYLAHDTKLDRKVALKVLAAPVGPLPEKERRRLLAEAKLVARLQSPHVVTLFRAHDLGGEGWAFEMEYLEGGSLADLQRAREKIDVPRAVALMVDVVRGLLAAHEAGVVHGDVKPANVLLDGRGNAKLADFGLGKFLIDASLEASSHDGPVGTPRYMAPEVVMGHGPQRASDVWGVGVILHELLTGQHPFPSTNMSALFHAVLNTPAPSLPGETPDELSELIGRCLEKDPTHRPDELTGILSLLERAALAPGRLSRVPRARPASFSITGRKGELDRLSELVDDAEHGRGGAVLITGEAGIGKSTLLASLAREATAHGFARLTVSMTPVEGLRRALLEGLRAVLAGKDFVRELGDSASVLTDEHLAEDSQFVWAFGRALERLERGAPLLVEIEDLHHATREELRVVADLAMRASGRRMLLATTCRLHEEQPADDATRQRGRHRDLLARPEFQQIELGPLSPEELVLLLQRSQGGISLAPRVARRIVRLAEGNPLFAKEILRHLTESDAIVVRNGVSISGPAWEQTDLPRRIHWLVSRRVDGLPEEQRAVLDVAAVDGVEFDGEAVAAVLDQPLLPTLRILQILYQQRGLVQPREAGYRFAHPLIHEVILASVAPAFRAALHRRLAEHLEMRVPRPEPERLGHHWECAGEMERARPHLLAAALAAERRQEIDRTIALCERAGLSHDHLEAGIVRQDPEVVLGLAACHADRGEPVAAERIYAFVLEAARSSGDHRLETRALLQRSKTMYPFKGLEVLDEPTLREAEHELTSRGASRDLSAARYGLGVLAKARGDLPGADRWFRKAEEASRASSHLAGASDALDQLASIAKQSDRWEEAERLYEEAATLSERVGRRVNAAISRVNRSISAFSRGAFDGVREDLERSIVLLELEGAREVAAQARLLLAHVLLAEGDTGAAEASCSAAEASLSGGENLAGHLLARLTRAELAVIRGDLDVAGGILKQARALADRRGRVSERLHADALDILRLAYSGEHAEAAELARLALGVARAEAHHEVDRLLGTIAQARLFGMPVGWPLPEPAAGSTTHVLMQAARSFADETSSPEPLEAAADRLLGGGLGEGRAALRVLGQWLRARASWRRGDPQVARRFAQDALQGAEAMGHVPYRRALERDLSAREGRGSPGNRSSRRDDPENRV